MSKQHTPGPWKLLNHPEDDSMIMVVGTRPGSTFNFHGQHVITCNKDNSVGHGRGNANLIAAAPEMLETLETVFDLIDSGGFNDGNAKTKALIERYLLAAIKKARGVK